MFQSRPEAMSFALVALNQIKNQAPFNPAITTCINKIKIAFENHEQDMLNICMHLNDLKSTLIDHHACQIEWLIKDITLSDYSQTLKEKFKNPLARRAESELFAHLLISPTSLMMQAVSRVSAEILCTIDRLERTGKKTSLNELLHWLKQSTCAISCGAFLFKPTLPKVKEKLQKNNPGQLAEIMHIHYMFSAIVLREIPIHSPNRSPVGRFERIAKDYPAITGDFFEDIKRSDLHGLRARRHICNTLMYESELYVFTPGRGRKGDLKGHKKSCVLSLMRNSQSNYDVGLPTHSSKWAPDCRGQDPDLDSPFVLDAINYDTLYIAGPSGMASTLLTQMELMANFEEITYKQHYLNVIAAYIIGAGFHNLHEVIGPAQYALDLVPGYHVFVSGKPKTDEEAALPVAPLYNVYMQLQSEIDPEFSEKRDAAWERYLTFFETVYMPKQQRLLERYHFIFESLVDPDSPTISSSEVTLSSVSSSFSAKESSSARFTYSYFKPAIPAPTQIQSCLSDGSTSKHPLVRRNSSLF